MAAEVEKKLTLTIVETGRALGISRTLTYRLVKEGRIPTVRLGKRLLVPRLALEKLLSGEGKP